MAVPPNLPADVAHRGVSHDREAPRSRTPLARAWSASSPRGRQAHPLGYGRGAVYGDATSSRDRARASQEDLQGSRFAATLRLAVTTRATPSIATILTLVGLVVALAMSALSNLGPPVGVWICVLIVAGEPVVVAAGTSVVVARRGRYGKSPASVGEVLAEEVKGGEALLAEVQARRLTRGVLVDDFMRRGDDWVRWVRVLLYDRDEGSLLDRWCTPVALWYLGRPQACDRAQIQDRLVGPLFEMLELLREIQRDAEGTRASC